MSEFTTIPTYGDRLVTHHRCKTCGEWCPKWQQMCICHPDYERTMTQKLKEANK